MRSTRGRRYYKNASQLIFSQKRKKSTRARCHSIMWSTAMSPLSHRRSLTRCSLNSTAENSLVGSTAGKVSSQPASFAGTAVPSSVPRCGIPTANTAGSSGNATESSKVRRNAQRRIWTSESSRMAFCRHLTSSSVTKSASLMTAA